MIALVPMLITTGLVLWRIFDRRERSRSWTDVVRSQASAANPATPKQSIYWESRPLPAQIDGDATEDVVGLVRRITQTESAFRYEACVGAFSGQTLRPIWVAGPFAEWSTGGYQMRVAIAADRVMVTDPRFVVHVLDRRTGKELSAFALSDRAEMVCPARDGRRLAWIPTIDRKGFIIDADAGTAKEAAKPSWCQSGGSRGRSECGTPARCAANGVDVPGAEEWGPYQPFAEEGMLVVIASKQYGTRMERLFGIDIRAQTVKWSTSVAPEPMAADHSKGASGDLAAGRFFATYSLTSPEARRLAAFDTSTGQRLWDVAADEAGHVTATRTRVYVRGHLQLRAFDPKDGRLLGTFGI